MNKGIEKLEGLITLQPKLHVHKEFVSGVEVGEVANWAINPHVIRWIFDSIPENGCTLETGCGYTSVVFAIREVDHTIISPYETEHEAIKKYCAVHKIDFSRLRFICSESQAVIHSLEETPLDLVLIDGDHSFPAPFIDWYYTAERLRKGGYCLVDDTQLITGKVLREFLMMEKNRWEFVKQIHNTAIFRKTTDEPVVRGFWWGMQPWSAQTEPMSFLQRLRRKANTVFHRLGIRRE